MVLLKLVVFGVCFTGLVPFSTAQLQLEKLLNFKIQDIPILQDNFGIKKGDGCIPLVNNIVKLLLADCQSKTDSLQWYSWGNQINNALKGGKIDLLGAAKETCRLQADRQNCQKLSQQVINCDIFGSIHTALSVQQAKSRCDQITDFVSLLPKAFQNQNRTPLFGAQNLNQNPLLFGGQNQNHNRNQNPLINGPVGGGDAAGLIHGIGAYIGNEIAGGIIRKFIGGYN